jgi:hypothetical protein
VEELRLRTSRSIVARVGGAFLVGAVLVIVAFYPVISGDAFGVLLPFYVYLSAWVILLLLWRFWRPSDTAKIVPILVLITASALGLPIYTVLASSRGVLLHDAARYNHYLLLRCFVSLKGMDRSELNEALVSSTIGGNTQIVKYLLLRGADPKARLLDNDTVLILAVRQGSLENSEFLLKFGADIDAQNREGMTALIEAVEGNQSQLVRLLLAAGANTDLQNGRGQSALTLARELHLTEIERILTERESAPAPAK